MIKCLKYLISSKIAFFILTTSIILSLNITPLISHIRHAPSGRSFNLIHNNVQDFYFYQSLMNEGADGAWLTTDPFTSEPHQPSVIFSYFLWLGKLSKLLGISYAVTYHLLRISLGFLFLLACYLLIIQLKIPYPRLTFLFFIFASPFLHPVSYGGQATLQPFMYFWTGMDPIRRVAYLPHHMFGALFLVISLILIIKFMRVNNWKYLMGLIITAPILAFVHTPSLFILLLILPPAIILSFMSSRATSSSRGVAIPNGLKYIPAGLLRFARNDTMLYKKYFYLLVYWLIGLLALLVMFSQTGRGFPWSQYITWEKTQQFPLMQELFGAYGILLPFALIGLLRTLFSRKFENLLTASWFTVPILFIPIASNLNISNIRLIQGVPFLPLAILASYGIQQFQVLTNDLLSKLTSSTVIPSEVKRSRGIFRFLHAPRLNRGLVGMTSQPKNKIKNYLVPVFVMLIFIKFTIPTIVWSLKDQVREYWNIYSNVYLDNRLFVTFDYINKNIPPKSVSVATFYTGNYLPAFTNTVSFIGHTGYTDNLEFKQKQVDKFFANKMTADETKDFLMRNKINLIFQGPDEKSGYNGILYPDLLKKIYDTEAVTLYDYVLGVVP